MIKRFLLALTVLLVAPTLYGGTVTGTLQGPSGLPVKNATLTFTLQQAGLLLGTGNVAQLTSQCWTSQDGSVVGLPNPLQPPTAAIGPTSTLPSGIYFIQYTFYNSAGESLPSPEFHIQTTVLQSLIVSPPVTFPANAAGMKVYIGATSGSETLQGTTTSATQQYTQNTALNIGSTPPTANSAPCTIAFNDTIIPYGGYNVSLTSSTGNAYPGWPQAWQANGGANGTINVSQGAPLWNGTVIYPAPVLSQPLNHGQQSISGPLDFGDYDVTNMGDTTACSVNSTVNVTSSCFAQYADLGAKVTAALATCGAQCELWIPAGSYSYSTSIILPLNIFGTYILHGSPGAVLNYTGNSDAIVTPIGASGPGDSQLIIEGFQLNGTSAAASGIHTLPTNRITIRDMSIQGFSAGDGIRVEGTNNENIYDNLITNNLIGVHLIPTFCNGTFPYVCSGLNTSGTLWSTNVVNVAFNKITDNTHWGIFDDRNGVGSGNTGSLGNHFDHNNLELNGSAGPTFGAVQIQKSTADTVEQNYLEGSPRQIVLGENTPGIFFAAQGTVIRDNYFTTVPATPFNIELVNTSGARIDGNSELVGPGTGGNNCYVNVEGQGEVSTVLNPNGILQTPPNGNRLCSAGSPIQTFAGTGSYIQFNQNYMLKIAFAAFPITAAASDTQASVNVAASSTCTASATKNGSQATAQGLIAQVYVQSGAGSFTIFHPTGNAGLLYDVYCTGPLNN